MDSSIFPRYGRVAIVDDKYEEVKVLQHYFAEKAIPYIFYDYSEMPDMNIEKMSGIRLLLLDIRLEDGNLEEKNIKSVLASTVERIIPIQNGPYGIILWTNEYALAESVEDYLNGNLSDTETTKPSFITAMDKKDFLSKASEDIGGEIICKYESQKMLAFLTEFENKAMAIPHNVIKMIVYSFASSMSNADVENTLLRLANTEKKNCDSAINATKIVLRQFLALVRDRYMEVVADIPMSEKLAEYWTFDFNGSEIEIENNVEQDAIINAVLNVNIYADKNDNLPGKVYLHTADTLDISEDILKKSTFPSSELSIKNNKHVIQFSLQPIELDITPSCDYAQRKNHMLRILYGYILFIEKYGDNYENIKYCKKITKQIPEYIYVSPILNINKKLCVLLLNTKMLGIKEVDHAHGLQYLFRLNDDITNEIRKKTGEVISRLGINSVE